MRNLFDMDNPLMRTLSRVFDLIILNLLTVLCCIPIITAGAAFAAMHQMLIRIVEDRDSYLLKPYFKCFAENFKKSTLAWLIIFAGSILIFVDFRILAVMESDQKKIMTLVLLGVTLFLFMIVQYVFPLQAHYENTIRATFSNALKLAIGFFPRTLLMLGAQIVLLVAFYKLWQNILPIYLLLGFSGTGYIKARIYVPIFHKIDAVPETDTEVVNSNGAEDIEAKILERQIPGRQ